ncbi:MAG: hypothetical protein IJU72_02045 [Bacteroidales bacterium]|nr:hypothetical protein [Bacteroidales bacterium]
MKRIVLKKKSESKNSKLPQMETLSSKQLIELTGGNMTPSPRGGFAVGGRLGR